MLYSEALILFYFIRPQASHSEAVSHIKEDIMSCNRNVTSTKAVVFDFIGEVATLLRGEFYHSVTAPIRKRNDADHSVAPKAKATSLPHQTKK